MGRHPVVSEDGRDDGRTLQEWLPEVVERLVEGFDPLRIILFGSLATDTESRDSDIDLLVVLPEVGDKKETMRSLRHALRDVPVPVDAIPTDPEEISRRGNVAGSVLRPALTSGKEVYARRS